MLDVECSMLDVQFIKHRMGENNLAIALDGMSACGA